MPRYTLDELIALKQSKLIETPEFEYKDIETVDPTSHLKGNGNGHDNWGARSQKKREPPVMPKAAIPFSQRALFDKNGKQEEVEVDEEFGDASDDEFAARYLLKGQKREKKKQETSDGAPIVNLSYAAALAASMKMSEESNAAVVEEGDDEGWVSVSNQKKRGKSFSKWR